jgi:hypothetical protein
MDKAKWRSSFLIEILYEGWDDAPSTPGIYVITSGKPINRLAKTDPRGIVYIGESKNLRNRLWSFWYAQHPASGFLWENPDLASKIIGKKCKSHEDVENILGHFTVKVATPIHKDSLDSAERATLYAYIKTYGELPPLNFSLPERWSVLPRDKDLNWGNAGLT